MTDDALRRTFLSWNFWRAAFHRGWWLVTSLYLVTEAGLGPAQLVAIGVAQGISSFAAEIPTGVLADTVSRKRSVVVFHLLAGPAMAVTGLVTDFAALVATQMVWGLAWTFTSGAEVAWIHDELEDPSRIDRLLAAQARTQQWGAAGGMIGFGALAAVVGLGPAIVVAGLAMTGLGVGVGLRFPERGFRATEGSRWQRSREILRTGLSLARHDASILRILTATLLVNGANEGFGRLFARQLVDLGLTGPPAPIIWLTGLGLVALALGVLALRLVEARIDRSGGARASYTAAALIGAAGIALVAIAPDPPTAMAGILVVNGIAWSVTRAVSTIWVNRRTTSEVRATVQSLLAQAEFVGEITLGIVLGGIAHAAGIPWSMTGAAALLVGAAAVAWRDREEPSEVVQARW